MLKNRHYKMSAMFDLLLLIAAIAILFAGIKIGRKFSKEKK